VAHKTEPCFRDLNLPKKRENRDIKDQKQGGKGVKTSGGEVGFEGEKNLCVVRGKRKGEVRKATRFGGGRLLILKRGNQANGKPQRATDKGMADKVD